MDDHGRTVREEDDIARTALDYLSRLFTARPAATSLLQDLVQPRAINHDLQSRLGWPYTEEEVVGALQEMHPTKAPGPDGLPAGFYQKLWPQVKKEVLDFCLNVLNNGATVQDVNQTCITLIQKVKKPSTMKQFRPISLCNTIYKLILKTIAIRLIEVLPQIISEEQSAFVKGRLITDNVMIAYEILHKLRGKRSGKNGYCALKVDMSKAYDRVSWDFIDLMMRKTGFPVSMINTVMECISSVRYSVKINGELYGNIQP